MALRKAVGWWLPYWFTLRRKARLMRYARIWSIAASIRVLLISAAVMAAAIGMGLHFYPAMQIPWAAFLRALLILPGLIALLFLALFGMPEHVHVKPESIWVGQFLILMKPKCKLKHNRLHRIRLVVRGRWTWLSCRYTTHRGTHRTLRCMVGERVDLLSLDELLTEIQHAIPTNDKPDPAAGSGLGLK